MRVDAISESPAVGSFFQMAIAVAPGRMASHGVAPGCARSRPRATAGFRNVTASPSDPARLAMPACLLPPGRWVRFSEWPNRLHGVAPGCLALRGVAGAAVSFPASAPSPPRRRLGNSVRSKPPVFNCQRATQCYGPADAAVRGRCRTRRRKVRPVAKKPLPAPSADTCSRYSSDSRSSPESASACRFPLGAARALSSRTSRGVSIRTSPGSRPCSVRGPMRTRVRSRTL